MIGGRVLDATAVASIAGGASEYTQAMLAVATDLGIPLAIPTSALQAAWTAAPGPARPWLERLPEAATVVVVDLTEPAARAAGTLAADAGRADLHPGTAHTAVVALARSWPVVTGVPDDLLALSPDIRTETIP